MGGSASKAKAAKAALQSSHTDKLKASKKEGDAHELVMITPLWKTPEEVK